LRPLRLAHRSSSRSRTGLRSSARPRKSPRRANPLAHREYPLSGRALQPHDRRSGCQDCASIDIQSPLADSASRGWSARGIRTVMAGANREDSKVIL
jgi:hypothetical protein